MLMEVLGFVCGVIVVGVAGCMFVRHESWKTIRAVYARENRAAGPRGNALIWPSH